MTDNDKQFLNFITGTFLPGLAEAGLSGTADDIKRLVRIIRELSTETQARYKQIASLQRDVERLERLRQENRYFVKNIRALLDKQTPQA